MLYLHILGFEIILYSYVFTASTSYKLLQVYSRYPCEKPLIERVFVRTG